VTISRIGIIADTHGVVHPGVSTAFANVDHIIHAGDIGGTHVLEALRALAPVTSVEGNNDGDSTGEDVIRTKIGPLRILLTHVLPRPHHLDRRVVDSLRTTPADLVVFGFNPASAGPRRFSYPTSVGLLEKSDSEWKAIHVALDGRSIEALTRFMNQLSRK
jgi:putative phosphoesterase